MGDSSVCRFLASVSLSYPSPGWWCASFYEIPHEECGSEGFKPREWSMRPDRQELAHEETGSSPVKGSVKYDEKTACCLITIDQLTRLLSAYC